MHSMPEKNSYDLSFSKINPVLKEYQNGVYKNKYYNQNVNLNPNCSCQRESKSGLSTKVVFTAGSNW